MNEYVEKLGDLIEQVRLEQPEESGHNPLNRYFAKQQPNGSTVIMRPGSNPVAQFKPEYSQSAKLAAVMSPEMSGRLFFLLRELEKETNLSTDTQEALNEIFWRLSFHIEDQG